jgi:hypothetical protein
MIYATPEPDSGDQQVLEQIHALRTDLAFDEVISEFGLPERVADELFDAALGYRIRRSTYVRRAEIEQRTATRDLARLTEAGLLLPVGETKGRHYVMGERLVGLQRAVLETRPPLTDPYPWMRERLASVPTPVR